MPCRLFALLALSFILPAAARADEATDLRDKAIKAVAKDPGDLKKLRTHTIKATGISKLGPDAAPATWELAVSWPGQLKGTWEFGSGTMKSGITLCESDDKGWRKPLNGPAVEIAVEELNDLRADAYALWVATLTTLNDSETKLATAGRAKVGNDAVVGLKVSRRPFQDVILYFDEKTGLLRKMSYRAREAGVNLNKEMIYDGHKEQGGLILPTKQSTLIQGREIYAWTSMEYSFPDKLDGKSFEKP
jgi:hypothetical protein